MGNPKDDWATCLYCGKRIKWAREYLSEEQEKVNEEIMARNDAAGLKRWEEGFEAPAFKLSGWGQRWTHGDETPGDVRLVCDNEHNRNLPEGRQWWTQKATPIEFCNERTQEGKECNLRAKERSEWSRYTDKPKCGRHLKDDITRYETKKYHEEQQQIREWATESMEAKAAPLKDKFGLSYTLVTGYNRIPDGTIIVNIEELLKVLEGVHGESID